MFLGVSVSHIAQLGMTLTWPNTLVSDLHLNTTNTIYGSNLTIADWQMDMMGESVHRVYNSSYSRKMEISKC